MTGVDPMTKLPRTSELHRLLAKHFDLEELRTVAFDLGVDWDELGGETKSARARELIAYLQRRNRLGDLMTAIETSRPDMAQAFHAAMSAVSTQESSGRGIVPLVDIYADREDWFDLPIAAKTTTPRPARVSETLYSNLLPVLAIPQILYSAPSAYRTRDQVRSVLHGTYRPPFVLKEKRLWTFSDLTHLDCPFRRVCDVNDISQVDSRSWMREDDRRRWLVDLFNQCLRRKCQSLGFLFDWQHNRFYFPPDGGQERSVEYQAAKRRARRRVAHPYRSLFWVHHAVRLSFVALGEQWYLKIEPAYTFTKDGTEFIDSRQVGPLATRRKSREYNLNVFNHLVFWRQYLGAGQDDFVILCGDQRMVISKFYVAGQANFGISDSRVELITAGPIEPQLEEELFGEASEEAGWEEDEDEAKAE
jgi:hypothetical protein